MLPSVVFLNEEMLLKIFAIQDVSNAAKLPAAHEKSSVALKKREEIERLVVVRPLPAASKSSRLE